MEIIILVLWNVINSNYSQKKPSREQWKHNAVWKQQCDLTCGIHVMEQVKFFSRGCKSSCENTQPFPLIEISIGTHIHPSARE